MKPSFLSLTDAERLALVRSFVTSNRHELHQLVDQLIDIAVDASEYATHDVPPKHISNRIVEFISLLPLERISRELDEFVDVGPLIRKRDDLLGGLAAALAQSSTLEDSIENGRDALSASNSWDDDGEV
jgi:fructose-1-phosphate kinase PfkB-like protein